jgi:glycosyltransferase involved in cell wall biosynthesis
MKAGILAIKFSKLWNVPYIVSEQSSLYETTAPDNFFRRSYFFRQNTKRIFKNADVVTNVSNTVGQTIQSLFNLKYVSTIHNVVNTNYFYFKPSVKNKFRWLHVSSLQAQKNISGIVQAFSSLLQHNSDVELIVAGKETSELTRLIERYHLQDHIHCVGQLDYKDVAIEMQQANAFVLFSLHENFPCVIPEALCCGLPVVSSNVGGVKEALNENNGLLIESGNIEALTNAMLQIMNNFQSYKRELISREAINKYNQPVIGKQFYSLYQQVLKRKN